MYMGKILTSCHPPLLSSQAGGQGHYALLTLSLAFGPLSPIISGKEFVPWSGSKKGALFLGPYNVLYVLSPRQSLGPASMNRGAPRMSTKLLHHDP